MCNPASGIATETKIWFSNRTDSHSNILDEIGIKDDKTPPNFIKFEIMPPKIRKFYAPLSEWLFFIDQNEFPDWYIGKEDLESRVRSQLPRWVKNRVVNNKDVDGINFRNEEKERDGRHLFCGEDNGVELYDRTTVELFDNAHGILFGCTQAFVRDKASCDLNDSSYGEFFDESSGKLFLCARAYAFESSKLNLYEMTIANMHDNSHAYLYGRSTAILYGHSTATICSDKAIVIDRRKEY
jgi:hypothetical protein